MIIAQISDTHILARRSDDPLGACRAEDLRRCIADINNQAVDAVIHTGDSVQHGTVEEYEHLRAILAPLKAPLFLTPGNRDSQTALRAAFEDLGYFPPDGELLHYTVEHYPVRLVALDSVAAGERKGVYGPQRLAWLQKTLASEPDKRTILFIHHPPFDIAEHYRGGYRRPQDAEDLAALVSRHPQVERLLCGHVHCWHREQWGDTVATTMPSVAVDLRKGIDAAVGAAPLYLLHTVLSGGGVVSQTRLVR
jgi:3',5'-cyclic AMP phosphodiesterase CpdA